jgi:predicted regulator of Ras-like GTPase activity (Roadblock/LC7/MglB family)
MKKLIFVSLLSTAAMFAQVATSADTTSTTVTKDHGKKSVTKSDSDSTVATPAGTSTNSSATATKTKKKHGKVVSKSTTSDSSSSSPQ